ncbi:hypothetical protein [Herbaspirillum frisingense]|uniref:hypothetical protein n=1 Tax=Herbaspirillum frisingense TaxID=92645 RepID=UPI0039B02FFA
MDIKSKVTAWSREDLEQATKAMVKIAGSVFGLTLVAYFVRFGPFSEYIFGKEGATDVSTAQAAWGQFGDFIGGSLNPFLSALTLVGLVFTILLQQESMARTQADSNNNINSLREQAELSLITARLQALSVTLDVITEMHAQAVASNHMTAIQLLDQKQKIANEILEINDALRNRPVK